MKEIVIFVVVAGFIISILLCAFGGKLGELFLFFVPQRVRVKGVIVKTFQRKGIIVISYTEPVVRQLIFTGPSHFLIIKNEEDGREHEIMIPNNLYHQIKDEIQGRKENSFFETVCKPGENCLIALKCKIK